MYGIKNLPKGRHAFNKKGNIRKDSNSKSKSKIVVCLKYFEGNIFEARFAGLGNNGSRINCRFGNTCAVGDADEDVLWV